MKTIYKYELAVLDIAEVTGRIEKFLSVQYQQDTGHVCAWALIDDGLPETTYVVCCYGTGHKVDLCFTGNAYIGTVQLLDGKIVLHYFAERMDSLELYHKRADAEHILSPELEIELGSL